MAHETEIKQDLMRSFSIPDGDITIPRERRVFANVPCERFGEIFKYAVCTMQFPILCTITGIDEGADFAVLYHLSREDGTVLTLATRISREKPAVKTITEFFPAAMLYERELTDLLGIAVEGLPEGTRYPLPDDWPADQYPLRKDWKPSDLSPRKEENHG